MTLYTCREGISENLTNVIPRIMTKSVQVKYTTYGRENNGVKKLNFSCTETCKLLLGKYHTFFLPLWT